MILNVRKIEAKTIAVKVDHDYPQALTAIFNNCRDRRDILKVSNNPANTIFVTVKTNIVDFAKEWLSQFGTVKNVYDVLVALIDTDDLFEYDYDKYADFIIAED